MSAQARPDGQVDGAGTLRLGEFIRRSMEAIIEEWVGFACTLAPASTGMTKLALRDHIEEILNFIADDLESQQTAREQFEKSQGKSAVATVIIQSAAEIHATLRLRDGFNIDQMVSEYRALRASVVKQWLRDRHLTLSTDVLDLTRFNEAIDQAIAESVAEYTRLIDRSRNMFLGIMGHDLRNPIGAASITAELLFHLAPPGSKQKVLAKRIMDATQRGISILNDLLDITRSAFGTDIPISKAAMDMADLGTELVAELSALAGDRSIHVDCSGDTKGEWDRARMGQVLSNLIGNAVQYSFPTSKISIEIHGEADYVTINVHNEGPPIPSDKLATIFEALTRGHVPEQREKSSTHLGLGLYIAKKIVVAHAAEMNVVSSPEAGTTFSVRLPRF